MERSTALRGEQMSPEAVAQEKHHFQKVLNAFAYYRWVGLTVMNENNDNNIIQIVGSVNYYTVDREIFA